MIIKKKKLSLLNKLDCALVDASSKMTWPCARQLDKLQLDKEVIYMICKDLKKNKNKK